DVGRLILPSAAIFNNYGCVEAMPRIALRRAEDAADPADVGPPIAGVEVRSGLDDGALEFRSRYGARAIIDDAGFRAIGDGDWVPSGDLGTVDGAGRVQLAGRRGEVF